MANREQMVVNLCHVGCHLESNLYNVHVMTLVVPVLAMMIPLPHSLLYKALCISVHTSAPMAAVSRPLRRLSVALGLTKAYYPEDCPPNDRRTHSAITADLSDFLVASKASYLKDPSAGDWTVVMGNEAGGTSLLFLSRTRLETDGLV